MDHTHTPQIAFEQRQTTEIKPELALEEVDGIPVIESTQKTLALTRWLARPASQSLILTAGSLVAGFALTSFMLTRSGRRGFWRRRGVRGEILASRSILLDVHLFNRK